MKYGTMLMAKKIKRSEFMMIDITKIEFSTPDSD